MEFDPTKPFGQVWGHSSVAFEQGGHMFDVMGELVVDSADPVLDPESEDEPNFDASAAFIDKVLAGGPVTQSNVYKLAEEAGLKWAEVIRAAAEVGVKHRKVRGADVWSMV